MVFMVQGPRFVVQGYCLPHHLHTLSAALKAYGRAGKAYSQTKTLFCAHFDYRPLRLPPTSTIAQWAQFLDYHLRDERQPNPANIFPGMGAIL